MIRRTGLLLFLLFLLSLATGCSSIRGERVDTAVGPQLDTSELPARAPVLSATPTATRTTPPTKLGDDDASESFDFVAQELYTGSAVQGAELFGQGSVIVTFVQPGCELSIGDGPTIADVAERTPEVTYVIVHSGANDEAYISFAQEGELYQENMVHLSDHLGALSARYGVTEFPTTLLIDSDLHISAVTGAMDADAQQQAIDAIVSAEV